MDDTYFSVLDAEAVGSNPAFPTGWGPFCYPQARGDQHSPTTNVVVADGRYLSSAGPPRGIRRSSDRSRTEVVVVVLERNKHYLADSKRGCSVRLTGSDSIPILAGAGEDSQCGSGRPGDTAPRPGSIERPLSVAPA